MSLNTKVLIGVMLCSNLACCTSSTLPINSDLPQKNAKNDTLTLSDGLSQKSVKNETLMAHIWNSQSDETADPNQVDSCRNLIRFERQKERRRFWVPEVCTLVYSEAIASFLYTHQEEAECLYNILRAPDNVQKALSSKFTKRTPSDSMPDQNKTLSQSIPIMLTSNNHIELSKALTTDFDNQALNNEQFKVIHEYLIDQQKSLAENRYSVSLIEDLLKRNNVKFDSISDLVSSKVDQFIEAQEKQNTLQMKAVMGELNPLITNTYDALDCIDEYLKKMDKQTQQAQTEIREQQSQAATALSRQFTKFSEDIVRALQKNTPPDQKNEDVRHTPRKLIQRYQPEEAVRTAHRILSRSNRLTPDIRNLLTNLAVYTDLSQAKINSPEVALLASIKEGNLSSFQSYLASKEAQTVDRNKLARFEAITNEFFEATAKPETDISTLATISMSSEQERVKARSILNDLFKEMTLQRLTRAYTHISKNKQAHQLIDHLVKNAPKPTQCDPNDFLLESDVQALTKVLLSPTSSIIRDLIETLSTRKEILTCLGNQTIFVGRSINLESKVLEAIHDKTDHALSTAIKNGLLKHTTNELCSALWVMNELGIKSKLGPCRLKDDTKSLGQKANRKKRRSRKKNR